MGGKAKATNPNYLTRVEAAQFIGESLAQENATKEEKKRMIDIVYRRLGEASKKGIITALPVAGGRTKQFDKTELFDFAKDSFGVIVEELKIQSQQDKQPKSDTKNNMKNMYEILRQDLQSIIRLYDRDVIKSNQAMNMIKELLNKEGEMEHE